MKRKFLHPMFCLLPMLWVCCTNNNKTHEVANSKTFSMKEITKKSYGKLPDGKEVFIYNLTNANGMEMKVINYGGIIVSLTAPDKSGKLEDIVLGFDSLQGYLGDSPFFGALIGRYGNRIAKGKFSLDGKEYKLAQNNDGNHLHGGVAGYHRVYWNIEEYPAKNGKALKLTYLSKDMEEGYPGNLNIEVIYTLTDSNELDILYRATTDKKTVVNLTQHTYFNLSGNLGQSILDHEVYVNADKIVPVDATLIPTGKLVPVDSTAFDFRKFTPLSKHINDNEEQLIFGKGFDHCWVITGTGYRLVAAAVDPNNGRKLEVYSTEPGIQLYSGNFLDGTLKGKGNTIYNQRTGFCLETEHFPDSPNQPAFPSTILEPGQTYETRTTYKFLVQ